MFYLCLLSDWIRPSANSWFKSVGLTIPLQITLSDFNLSGFVILVFSKQKGITVVFRNDPLESLKVSSTFDSIPFVRDYLQKEIEGQLRILFMDELPAIIHRLSLRLWVPEYRNQEENSENTEADNELSVGPAQDSLLNAPLDPVDASGNVLSSADIASLSLDSGVEMHSLFSRKNLLSLATLTDSQRTLSLFTPSISDVVFRAWAGSGDHNEGIMSPTSPSLSRSHSQVTGFGNDTSSVISVNSRSSYASAGYGPSMTSARHSKAHSAKKRKKRVVDLRKHSKADDTDAVSDTSTYTESTSASSVYVPSSIPEEPRDDIQTPPVSPGNTIRPSGVPERMPIPSGRKVSTRMGMPHESRYNTVNQTAPPSFATDKKAESPTQPERTSTAAQNSLHLGGTPPYSAAKGESVTSGLGPSPNNISLMEMTQNSSILEQAWMMNLAGEIARRIQETKTVSGPSPYGHLNGREQQPPPAYRQ